MSRQPDHLRASNLRMTPFCDLIGWTLPQFLAARRALQAEYWPEEQPHFWLARPTDNDASQDAADAVRPRLPNLQLMLFVFMLLHPQPQLHEVAEAAFAQCGLRGQSTARTRCSEMEKLGLVERWGPKVRNSLGSAAYRYRIKPWVRRRASVVLAGIGLDVPAYADDEGWDASDGAPVAGGPVPTPSAEGAAQQAPAQFPLPEDHGMSARVVSLDEDTGNIKNYWLRDQWGAR